MDDDLQTIAAIAAGNPDFSILVTALEATDLVDAVDNADDALTVFAPTNAAFATLAADLGYTGDPEDAEAVFDFIATALAGLDPETNGIGLLTDILLYHVSPSAQSRLQIANSESVATLLDATQITPTDGRLVDLEPDLLDPSIVIPDIPAANGTIQAIDRVLLPVDIAGNDTPSIFDIASTTDGFAVLTAALEASGLDAVVANPDAEFTVFAPTDAAFGALAQSLGFTGDVEDTDAVFAAIADVLASLDPSGDPIPLLTDILLYHVVPGAQSLAELQAAPQVETALAGTAVILTEEGAIFDADPEATNAQIVDGLTDLAASNGTVQVIDAVLLPIDVADPEPTDTIADIVAASGPGFDSNGADFDILLAALEATDLVAAFTNPDDDLTVFAPTDAAFLALAADLGQDTSGEEAAFNGIVATFTELFGSTEEAVTQISNVLLYHVIPGSFTRSELALGNPADLGDGVIPFAAPDTDGEGLRDVDPGFDDPDFLDAASDIVAANGIIQAIDAVLIPANLPDASDVTGTDEDDTLEILPETRAVDGLEGEDTAVFDAAFADATFGYIPLGFTVTVGEQTVETRNVEAFEFADETVLVSFDETAAQVFRAFGVGFGREGDIAGITFWTEVAEEQGIGAVADAILLSDEFSETFGGIPPETGQIVEAFYENFLGREADEAGLAFWTDAVTGESFDTSDLLLAFSESNEFRALTENTFDDGVLLFA